MPCQCGLRYCMAAALVPGRMRVFISCVLRMHFSHAERDFASSSTSFCTVTVQLFLTVCAQGLECGHRPRFHMRVSAGEFQRAFPRKKKCISMHAETRLRNHGIRLVVARHFHCLHKFKVVYMRIVSVWTTRARKSRSSSSVSARG